MIRFLLPNPPAGITPDLKAYYWALCIAGPLTLAAHIILTIMWNYFDIHEMVVYHYAALPVLAVVVIIVRQGRLVAALIVTSFEFIAHASLGTYYTGCGSGMHFTLTMVAFIWLAYPGNKAWKFRMVCFLMLILQAVLLGIMFGRPPVYVIPDNALRWMTVTMVSFTLIPMVTIFILQAISATWYESLQKERDKSEHLLLNILPRSIAERLKLEENVIADRFDSASVLFLDIVNFTTLSASMAAHQVVSMLNEIFSSFDVLTEKYGLEKIKTIGDAYMAVAGIPDPQHDHARRVAGCAMEIMKELYSYNVNSGSRIDARIGICSGPVVAGVIGKRKFIYDLWGDTVNTASRMESHGLPNRIQVTETTYHILKDDYTFEERGVMEIKGKGPMKTWFLACEK